MNSFVIFKLWVSLFKTPKLDSMQPDTYLLDWMILNCSNSRKMNQFLSQFFVSKIKWRHFGTKNCNLIVHTSVFNQSVAHILFFSKLIALLKIYFRLLFFSFFSKNFSQTETSWGALLKQKVIDSALFSFWVLNLPLDVISKEPVCHKVSSIRNIG